MYWLELLHATNNLTQIEFLSIHGDATSLLKMLRSAILTTKRNTTKRITHNS